MLVLPLHVQACLGLPSKLLRYQVCLCMGVSRLTISLITRGVCAHVLHIHVGRRGLLSFESLGSSNER